MSTSKIIDRNAPNPNGSPFNKLSSNTNNAVDWLNGKTPSLRKEDNQFKLNFQNQFQQQINQIQDQSNSLSSARLNTKNNTNNTTQNNINYKKQSSINQNQTENVAKNKIIASDQHANHSSEKNLSITNHATSSLNGNQNIASVKSSSSGQDKKEKAVSSNSSSDKDDEYLLSMDNSQLISYFGAINQICRLPTEMNQTLASEPEHSGIDKVTSELVGEALTTSEFDVSTIQSNTSSELPNKDIRSNFSTKLELANSTLPSSDVSNLKSNPSNTVEMISYPSLISETVEFNAKIDVNEKTLSQLQKNPLNTNLVDTPNTSDLSSLSMNETQHTLNDNQQSSETASINKELASLIEKSKNESDQHYLPNSNIESTKVNGSFRIDNSNTEKTTFSLIPSSQNEIASLKNGKANFEVANHLSHISDMADISTLNAVKNATEISFTQVVELQKNISNVPITQYIAEPFGSSKWSHAMNQKIIYMANDGNYSATLELNPPDLGPIQVVLDVNNDMVDASFVSSHLNVREAINAASPKLKEMMEAAGMSLNNFFVSADSQSHQHNHRNDTNQQHNNNNQSNGLISNSKLTETAHHTQVVPNTHQTNQPNRINQVDTFI